MVELATIDVGRPVLLNLTKQGQIAAIVTGILLPGVESYQPEAELELGEDSIWRPTVSDRVRYYVTAFPVLAPAYALLDPVEEGTGPGTIARILA